MSDIKHPAKYSKPLLDIFKNIVYENYPYQNKQYVVKILDPFAGSGRIHDIDPHFDTYGIEIEPEWASLHHKTICADSTCIPFPNDYFEFIITSPTYGNRMADHHNAKDGTKRNTYTHVLGRQLHTNNSGKMQFGYEYKELHKKVYGEAKRVLQEGGYLVLNMKNHIRKGVEIDVCGWHKQCLVGIGFEYLYEIDVQLKGNGFGKNMDKKIPYEKVMVFRKNELVWLG